MIDPNKWFALTRAAQSRNENPIREQYKALGGKLREIAEGLDGTHNISVHYANIAADKAYRKVFQATYEATQRAVYAKLAPPSLAAHYDPKDRPRRIKSDNTEPNRWYDLWCLAWSRNDDLFWRALQSVSDEDLDMVNELLEESRLAAVEPANLAAERAYVNAFNEAYDANYRYYAPDIPTQRSEIEDGIQDLVKMGLLVDSGRRRWSPVSGRYQAVWIHHKFAKRPTTDEKVMVAKRPTTGKKVVIAKRPTTETKVMLAKRTDKKVIRFRSNVEKVIRLQSSGRRTPPTPK